MILHGYWRSGTSYRTRIALNLKGLTYRQAPVSLIGGEQRSEAFLRLNPQGLVPALEVEGAVLTQSPAILEWLEETHPEPALLPADPMARAKVRAMAAIVGCDIHPLNNLRVTNAVKALGQDQASVDAWAGRWITAGFDALERLVEADGPFCAGPLPTLADCYLVPQMYSARRFNLDLSPWPRLAAIDAHCATLPAFADAHPDRQPDAT